MHAEGIVNKYMDDYCLDYIAEKIGDGGITQTEKAFFIGAYIGERLEKIAQDFEVPEGLEKWIPIITSTIDSVRWEHIKQMSEAMTSSNPSFYVGVEVENLRRKLEDRLGNLEVQISEEEEEK